MANVLFANLVLGKHSGNSSARNEQQIQAGRQVQAYVSEKKQAEQKAAAEAAKAKAENDAIIDAIKFTADFYKELTEKFGEQSAKVAKELADAAKGKQLRSVDEALKAFDKYKDVLNKKFSVKDREAIAKALVSIDRDLMAKNLAKFSKAFNYTGKIIDFYDTFIIELPKAIRTQNFRPFFVKLETIGAGMAATALTAVVYSIILGTPLGIFGFALMMTLVSALVDEKLMEEINKIIGI